MKKKIASFFEGEGFTSKEVVAIVIPVMIDQFFLVAFNFINTAMISSSGAAAISAVNMVGSINIFLVQLFVAIGLGGTVLISQAFGRKDYQKLGKYSTGVIHTNFIVGLVIMSVCLIFRHAILNVLFGGAEQAVMTNAQLFFTGILFSYPAFCIIESINGSLRGLGYTKESLKNSLIMNVLYLLGNVLFINFLGLGIKGLIFSLLISRYVSIFVASKTLLKHRQSFKFTNKDLVTIRPEVDSTVIKTALPFAAEQAFFNGGKIIMQMMIVSFGTTMIAANAIAVSWVQLGEIIPSALSIALVPIVGQSVGRKNIGDIKKMTKTFVATGMFAFLCVDVLLIPLFPVAMKIFNAPQETITTIFTIYMIVLVMHVLAWSTSFILPSALRAVGDGKFTTIVSLISMWVFRVGIGYIVGVKLGYGLIGIFVIMTLEWFIRSILFIWRFRSEKWLIHFEK